MFSWIPFSQIVGIGGTGETWEASMKCELDALSHGHEECEFNNVVMICGETWELNYSRIQQRMVTCHWWNIDMGHGMFSQGKISIELWRKNMHFAWANGILTTEPYWKPRIPGTNRQQKNKETVLLTHKKEGIWTFEPHDTVSSSTNMLLSLPIDSTIDSWTSF